MPSTGYTLLITFYGRILICLAGLRVFDLSNRPSTNPWKPIFNGWIIYKRVIFKQDWFDWKCWLMAWARPKTDFERSSPTDILSVYPDMLCDISSGILSGAQSDIHSDILSGILSVTCCDMLYCGIEPGIWSEIFLTYIMLYIPSDPSDIVSEMLSHIYSDILSDIVSHIIISHILSDMINTKQFI